MPDYTQSKSRTKSSIKALSSEINNLEPSSIVTFFEIDLTEIMEANDITNLGVEANAYGLSDSGEDNILRFHNNINIFNSYLKWQGKTYYPAPIQAEGFEVSSRGTLPTPEFTISTQSEEGVNLMGLLRHQIRKFGDVIGAKVTRIRTFAKFLDVDNFLKVDSSGNVNTSFLTNMASENLGEIPQGFEPDPYSELPRDIYYIERKVSENKAMLKYQLASSLDLEGLTLPKRVIFADRCMFQYRGPGCWYQHYYDEENNTGKSQEIMKVIETIWSGSGSGNWTNVTSRFQITADGAYSSGGSGVAVDPASDQLFRKGDIFTFSGGATLELTNNVQTTSNKNIYPSSSKLFFGTLTGTVSNNETASINYSYGTFTSNTNNANLAAIRASSYSNIYHSIAESPVFTVKSTEIFRLRFKLTLTSGQIPTFQIINAVGAKKLGWSNRPTPTDLGNGTYSVDFEVNNSANTATNNAKIQIFNSADSNFTLTEVELAKMSDEVPIIRKAGLTNPELKYKLLPTEAPPVATDNDEPIVNIIEDAKSKFIDNGRWLNNREYAKGNYVYQEKNDIKYYYVAKVDTPKATPPPNSDYWVADQCSKSLKACRMRWGTEGSAIKDQSCQCVIGGAVSAGKGGLPYGGFPAAKRVQQTLT